MVVVFRVGNALALAALTLGFSLPAGAIDVVGSQVTLGWTAASGPVSGYYVIVARDAAPAKVEAVTLETQKTISATVGQTIVVQVAAFAQDGVAGPVSPPSNPITFVASTPAPSPTPPPDPTPPPGNTPIPVARDFNGDGVSDLVVQSGSSVRIWALQGGRVVSEISLPNAPSGARVVGAGDYDGNQTADLLWENAQTGALTLWLLQGGVVTATAALDRSSLPSAEQWHVSGSSDVDGDGADDLVLFSRVKGEVETWTLSGTSVATRTRLPGHIGAWSVVAVDDFDGDRMAEIIWLDEVRRVLELDDPAAAAPLALGDLASGWQGLGAVDFAGDGLAKLVMHQTTLGTTQAWALDDGGILGASDLPNAKNLGRFAGSGDFDGDGGEDVCWSDPQTGATTLWLGGSGALAAVSLDRPLASGSVIVSGATGSDDSAFRARFCSGDLNGDRAVDGADFAVFKKCYRSGSVSGACAVSDMDSDGAVTSTDLQIFKMRFQGKRCDG